MLIRSDSLLAQLAGKARQSSHDRSRHLLCPSCKARTRLYVLSDGRRKCGSCGKKFVPRRKSSDRALRRHADLLLCFMLDFPARQAATATGIPYRVVIALYASFRRTIAEQNLVPGKIRLMLSTETCDRGIHGSAFCERCRRRFSCKGRLSGDAPVFGVKMLADGRVFIDPLRDEEAAFRFDRPSAVVANDRYSGYSGFICRGNFRRFADREPRKDGAEQLWSWMSERLRRHHGIWRRNAGLYLKELEWKYNNRSLAPEEQAMRLGALLPPDFLRRNHGEPVRNPA